MSEPLLAGRATRLGAALIDGLILVVPNALLEIESVPDAARLVAAAASLGLLIWQIVWLARRGQTIGKRLLGIRIVRRDTGENGGFKTNVLLRALVSGLLNLVPLYFLVDSLFIFRADRLCVHDFLAGTRVVVGQPDDPAAPAA